ncbi:MAG: hypothetical protein FJZ01_27180, partial [Candidatus Sericytochromatia bacterium]|nr:hypothetical protein [Candidatus Tanganyikabacteria bacterium]
PAERGGAPAPRGRKPGGVRPDPRAGIQPGSGEGLIEGQSGRFRNRVVGGDQGVASEAEAGTGGPGPGGSPEEVAGAPPVDLPDFGPRDPKRPLNPKEAAAVKDGVSRTEAQLEDLADLLSQAGALPRNVGDKPLPGPQRALLKRLANLARRHGLAAEHHLAALETAATPRLTGFLKAGEASALRGAIAALLPALKGRIGHKQAALRQLTGFLGQAALEPKERLAALRVLQSIAGSPAAAPPGPEPAARMLRPVLPQVVADARKVAAPAPPATAAPEAPAAVPAEQAETAEIGLAAARREAVADRQETRRLERARQEERSDLRGADAREEQRRAERKRVLERIAKWQELRQGGKGSAGTPESVAARRFRFLRDIARRQDADSRGGPRARGGRDADRDQQASPRAYLAVLRPVAPERLAALRREAAARRAESAVARSLSGASEREARQLAEREVVDKLETARRRVQEEEGRIVERRRLDIEEQHRLDEARRRDRDETERTAARKRWERDDQERHVQRRRQEREEHEDYLRRRRDREEREREDQRRRDEEELRSRRSLAREQAARQAAGLTSHDGGLGGDVAAEFGVRAPSEQAKQDDIDRISGV